MKNKLLLLGSFVGVFVIVALLIKQDSKPITEQQIANLGKVVDKVFSSSQRPATPPVQQPGSQQESMIAIIYNRPDETWFFKARGLSSLVDQRSEEFSQLFLDQLTWDDKGEPSLSHVPSEYQQGSTAAMRFATFNMKGLEVSVTRLAGQQSIEANITRWKRQLSLPANAPQFVKFENNKQTVLVRLDQQAQATSQAQPPAKEELKDFLEVPSSEDWQVVATQSAMASATIALNQAGQSYPIAVLRLPSSVPLDTILGIWKERVGVAADQPFQTEEVTSQAQQTWQIIDLQSDNAKLLIAMHNGDTRYTFLRLSSTESITPELEQKFKKLISELKVTKP